MASVETKNLSPCSAVILNHIFLLSYTRSGSPFFTATVQSGVVPPATNEEVAIILTFCIPYFNFRELIMAVNEPWPEPIMLRCSESPVIAKCDSDDSSGCTSIHFGVCVSNNTQAL